MSVLTITSTEVLTLARLNTLTGADLTAATADVTAVISYEQDAQEQRIIPAFLATTSLAPLLRRGIAKIIAAEVLEMRARDNSLTGFTGAGVVVGKPPEDYTRRLREDAEKELAPYLSLDPLTAAQVAKAKSEDELLQSRIGGDQVAIELAKIQADTAKLGAETTLLGAESTRTAAESTKLGAESTKLGAQAALIGNQSVLATNQATVATRRATKLQTEYLKQQYEAGVITLAEYRSQLGLSGSPPTRLTASVLPVSVSPSASATQSKLFGKSEGERANADD